MTELRAIISNSAMWSADGETIAVEVDVGVMTITDWVAKGEPEWEPLLAGAFGEIAAYAEPSTANGLLKVDDLVGFAKRKREAVIMAGVSINVATEGAPALIVTARTDELGERRLQSALKLAELHPDALTPWASSSGSVMLTLAQMRLVAEAAFGHGQAAYAAYGAVSAAIFAGAITKLSEIETPPPPLSWPGA